MKHTGICPKCSGQDILYIHGIQEAGEIGNNIYTGITSLTQSPVGRCLCESCGYIEEWLDNLHDIPKIKKRFKPYKWGE